MCSPECFKLISLSLSSVKCSVRMLQTSSSFSICLSRQYRSLEAVDSPSLEIFKTSLDKVL